MVKMHKKDTKNISRYYWQLLGIALFLMNSLLLYIFAPSADSHFELDSYVYDYWGHYFVQTHSLYDQTMQHVAIQPIGYHLVVGLIYSLFGYDYRWIIVIQFLLAVGCLLLIYTIAKNISNEVIARGAMLVSAFNIGFLIYTQLLLTEILITFLFLLFFERIIVQWLTTALDRYLLQAYVILSISTFIKPIALVYIYPFLLFVLLYGRGSWRDRIIRVLIGVGIFFTPIFLYIYRNYLLYGAFIFAPMMAINMCQFMCKLMAYTSGVPYKQLFTQYMPQPYDYFNQHVWVPMYSQLQAYVIEFPLQAAYVWFINVGKTAFGMMCTQLKVFFNPAIRGGVCSYFSQSMNGWSHYVQFGALSPVIVCICYAEVIFNCLRIICVPFGLYALHSKRAIIYLFVSFIITSIIITGTDGCARYRMPAEGLLIILMVLGIYYIYRLLNRILYSSVIAK